MTSYGNSRQGLRNLLIGEHLVNGGFHEINERIVTIRGRYGIFINIDPRKIGSLHLLFL